MMESSSLGGPVAMPDFLVIGAPKAGTTALNAALARHPGLYMSAIKEPKFFLSDGPPPTKGGPGDALTYRQHVRARLERAPSNWTHLWSAGLEPIGDFVRACGEEERRIAAGWASFWHYVGLGRYGEQLEYLFTLFPREQVLVLRYRLLVDEPLQSLDRICEFLGVQTGVLTEIPRHNVTSHPESTLAHSAVSLAQRAATAVGTLIPGLTAATLTGPLERFLQRHSRDRQPLSWEQRQEILPGFETDIKLLEDVLGESFADWSMPRERSGGMVGGRPAGQGQARNGRRISFKRSPLVPAAVSAREPLAQLGEQGV